MSRRPVIGDIREGPASRTRWVCVVDTPDSEERVVWRVERLDEPGFRYILAS